MSARTVVIFAGSATLSGVDRALRNSGIRVLRLRSLETRPVDPGIWLRRLSAFRGPDTALVTSRTAVLAGVVPWLRAEVRRRSIEFWAVGPGTTAALRAAGLRRIRHPRTLGALGVARALGREGPRRIVYFRSAAAGTRLARELRAQGHEVADLVVYRLDRPAPLGLRACRAVSRADLLVVTSPSGLSELRRQLDRRTFRQLARARPLLVLGERSRRAARGHGFRHISVAPSTTAQRFTRHLLRELDHAGP
jgi:uroporphyrinogen-III synthase